MSKTIPVYQVAIIFSLSTLSFAIMNAFGKYLSNYSTVQIVFFRNFIALLFIASVMLARQRSHLLKTTRIKDHFWRGLFGLTSMYCVFTAFKYLPLAEVSAIGRTEPIILAILSIFLLGEKPKFNRWIAIAIGMMGVLIMLNPKGVSSIFGLGLAFSHAVLAALAMVMVHKLGKTESTDSIVFYFMLWGSLVSAIFLPFVWSTPNFSDLLFMLGLGIFGAVGQLLMVLGYRVADASLIAGLNYTQIIWSSLIGYIVWSEVPRMTVIIGALVVLASQLYLVVSEKKKNNLPV